MLRHTLHTDKYQKHAGHQQIIALAFDKVNDQGVLQDCTWAARCNTWLLIELTPKGVVFSFLLQDCDLAIERDPKEFAAWFNRGNALARLQDYGGALDSYRTAADLAPGIAGYR